MNKKTFLKKMLKGNKELGEKAIEYRDNYLREAQNYYELGKKNFDKQIEKQMFFYKEARNSARAEVWNDIAVACGIAEDMDLINKVQEIIENRKEGGNL